MHREKCYIALYIIGQNVKAMCDGYNSMKQSLVFVLASLHNNIYHYYHVSYSNCQQVVRWNCVVRWMLSLVTIYISLRVTAGIFMHHSSILLRIQSQNASSLKNVGIKEFVIL